jgi:NAD(P)-dependent dehydrogenase (short-subunit alcohol dehydrogenase family)
MASSALSVFQKDSTAVITGGASGIGLALAKRCVAYGMRVLVADWDEELLGQVGVDIAAAGGGGSGGGSVEVFKMDVGKVEDWEGLKRKVDADFGGECLVPPLLLLLLLVYSLAGGVNVVYIHLQPP